MHALQMYPQVLCAYTRNLCRTISKQLTVLTVKVLITAIVVQLDNSQGTVFLRSDAVAILFIFAVQFCAAAICMRAATIRGWRLFLWKSPPTSMMAGQGTYERLQRRLLDTVSSKQSLSFLLSAVKRVVHHEQA